MAGVHGFGTLLKMGSTPTTIAHVTNITGPGYSSDPVEVTAHDSPSAYREYVAGLLDAGDVGFDLNFDPSETTHRDAAGGIIDVFNQRAVESFVIEFPDGVIQCAFSGIVTAFEPDMPFDDKMTASATVKVTGKPTWTYV